MGGSRHDNVEEKMKILFLVYGTYRIKGVLIILRRMMYVMKTRDGPA